MSETRMTRATLLALVHLPGLLLLLAMDRFWAFVVVNGLNPYDEKRLLELAGFLIMAVLAALPLPSHALGTRAIAAMPGRSRAMMLAVVVLGFVSALRAEYIVWALVELALFVAILWAIAIIADLYDVAGPAFVRALPMWLAVGAAVYLIYFFIVYFSATQTSVPLDREKAEAIRGLFLYPNFSNRRFLDQTLTWTLPLIVLPWMRASGQGPLPRIGLYLIAAGWWMLLFASDGRGTAFGVTVGLAAAVAVMGSRVRTWLVRQIGAAAGGGALYLLVFVGIAPDHGKILARITDAGRLELWSAALRLAKDHPWLGVGPMQYAADAPVLSAHPHNAILQWLAEWGTPATVVMALFVAMAIVAWVRQCRALPRNTSEIADRVARSALTAALAGALAHAMVSGIIVMPLSQLLLVVICGWAWGVYRAACAAAPPAPTLLRVVVPVAGLLAAGFLAQFAWRHLPPPAEPWRPGLADACRDQPRFWMRGRLADVLPLAPGETEH